MLEILLRASITAKIKKMKTETEREEFIKDLYKIGTTRYENMQRYINVLNELGYEDVVNRATVFQRPYDNFIKAYNKCKQNINYKDDFSYNDNSRSVTEYLISLLLHIRDVYNKIDSDMYLEWPTPVLEKLSPGERVQEWWGICCSIDAFYLNKFIRYSKELICCSYIDNNYNGFYKEHTIGLLYKFGDSIAAMYNDDLQTELEHIEYTEYNVPEDFWRDFRHKYVPIRGSDVGNLFVKCKTSDIKHPKNVTDNRFCHRILPIELLKKSNEENSGHASIAANEIVIYNDIPYGLICRPESAEYTEKILDALNVLKLHLKMFIINEDNSVTRIK